MSLKTCIITNQYPPQVGGVGHSAYRIANLLAENGFQVQVVDFQKHSLPLPLDESYSTTEEAEVLVHRVKVFYPNRNDNPSLSEAEILTRYNREMFQALQHFQKKYQYEVLHGFFLYPAGFIAGLVGRLHSVKTIVSIRGNDVGKYAFDPLRMPFIRSALENADFVTSVASNLIELADRTLTPISKKATTILNSVDITRLQPQTKPELELKSLVIGTSGLFRYKKGLVYLFKALAGLNGHIDYTLLLAGDFFKEEDEKPQLEKIKDFGLSNHTVITGKIPSGHMADYLQLFDIMVFPSLYSEGCPLSMLEAMAMKKAIVASRTGAIPEIIRDGENGLLVDPGSSKEIADAIMTLVSDSDLRMTLGENAAKTASEMTPERELNEWLQVYKKVCDVTNG